MKTIKVKQVVMILAVVLISSLTVSAYNGNNRNNRSKNAQTQSSCINEIQGLSADQISSIQTMETAHVEVMDKLRAERQSTTDEKTKAEIRIKMIDQSDSHQAEVKKLLTPEQQATYDSLHSNKRKQKYSKNRNRSDNGRGNNFAKGNGQGNNCIQDGSLRNGNSNNRNNRF